MKAIIYSLTIIIFFSCQDGGGQNCYPEMPVARTVILVADTTIFGNHFIPENDTTKTYPVFDGIGFVRLNGVPVHKPSQEVTLSEGQQKQFLKILRPLPTSTEGTVTDCIPYFRHVVLFYDKADKLIGQMHLCFECRQVRFKPEPKCLDFFDNHRIAELKHFFEDNNIHLFSEN